MLCETYETKCTTNSTRHEKGNTQTFDDFQTNLLELEQPSCLPIPSGRVYPTPGSRENRLSEQSTRERDMIGTRTAYNRQTRINRRNDENVTETVFL